ncbi:hypothetical protein V491_04332 [Pseudogymnoascus sp. VKM F-3775]|nr:hypothetical protein V491_04332 [Pseudogymnoascus sp. VKM F-3775]
MHATASVNGQVIAETDNYEVVEGNIYFPPASVDQKVLTKSDTRRCIVLQYYHWKSVAPGVRWNKTNALIETELKDAAWYYPQTFEKANHIKNYVAFYKSKVDVKSE